MPIPVLDRALRSRNYRLFLLGQGVSWIGTWMQHVATAWLIYRLTNSPWLLGLIGFSRQIPSLLLAPLGGVIADRCRLHRALLVTQSLAMVQSLILLAIIQLQIDLVLPLILLELALGTVNAFDMPLRQAFLVQMVPNREHLGNAIALNSSIVNGARLVGPSLAGLIIALWGEATCIALNAVSYAAVLLALLAMRDLPANVPVRTGRMLENFREGVRYAFAPGPIRMVLGMLATFSFLSMSVNVLIPVFARDVLKGGAGTNGFLTGAMGLGAFAAAVYLASRNSAPGLGRLIAGAGLLFGSGQIALSYSRNLPLSLAVLTVTGCCLMLMMAASNTLIQTLVDDDKRGRVMSFYTMALMGFGPLGSLTGGLLAARIGAVGAVRVSGTVCVTAALLFATRIPSLRRMVSSHGAPPQSQKTTSASPTGPSSGPPSASELKD